jgi:predicted RNA methylase
MNAMRKFRRLYKDLAELLQVRTSAESAMLPRFDPRAQCERYTDSTYALMRDDHARTAAYGRAIRGAVPGRVCLDIGTGALALLAVMAAKAGARHVYAVEANEDAYRAALTTVAEQGLAERVTVLHGYSTTIAALPQPIDVLLHEIIGEIAGSEGVAAAIHDARRHLAARPPAAAGQATTLAEAVSVPARA